MTTTIAATITRADAEAFLYLEARLMDTGAYREWLELWADDALYWIPCNTEDLDPSRAISFVYAARPQLEDRVARLISGVAYAQEPVSITSRVVANVEIEDGPSLDEVVVHSVFNVTELRRGAQHTFAGRSTHSLRRVGGDLRMTRKKVVLVNRDEFIANLTFLL